MTKRILAMVLVLVMVLSLLPMVSVFADSAEEVVASPKAGTHTDAGHGDDCGVTTGWLPWDKADSLPTSGNYYLTQNVTLTKEHNTIDGELNLCLNGYVIKQTAKARVMSLKDKSGAKLTICDCTAYEEDGVYYAGAVTGGNDQTASTGGGCIFVRKSTELVIYDGRFVGNSSQYTAGCILTQATATTGGFPGAHYYFSLFSSSDSWAQIALNLGCSVGLWALIPASIRQLTKEKSPLYGILGLVLAALIVLAMIGVLA